MKTKKRVDEVVFVPVWSDTGQFIPAAGIWSSRRAAQTKGDQFSRRPFYRIARCRLVETPKKRKAKK